LPHLNPAGAQTEKSLDLIRRRHAVGAQIEVETILDGFALRNAQHVDRRPRPVGWRDADHLVVFINHRPSENAAPEVGYSSRMHGVDCDSGDSARHSQHHPAADAQISGSCAVPVGGLRVL